MNGKKLRTWRIPVTWSVCGIAEVEGGKALRVSSRILMSSRMKSLCLLISRILTGALACP